MSKPFVSAARRAGDNAHVSDTPPVALERKPVGFRRFLRPQILERTVGVADFILIVSITAFAGIGYQWFSYTTINWDMYVIFGFLIAGNFCVLMQLKANYALKNLTSLGRQVRNILAIWSSIYGILAVVAFTMKISTDFSRGAILLSFFVGAGGLVAWHVFVARFVSQALAHARFAERNILVIAEKHLAASSTSLAELRSQGLKPMRVFEVSKSELEKLGICTTLRAKLSDAIATAQSNRIKDVYLLIGWQHRRLIEGIVSLLVVLPVSVHLIPDENTARFLDNPVTDIGRTWAAELAREPLSGIEQLSKRFLDLVLAFFALLLLCPLLIVTAGLVRLDSRGPVLFRQKRNGFSGHAFDIYKFRTMHVLENGPVIAQTKRNDPRVTRLGRWLRRSSIDELPQLLNVLRGEMSLVGPRPHALAHNSEYEELIANYAFRHHVKPGITGWAQVKGFRGETETLDLMQRRVEHDLWYIKNWSFGLDLKILVRTMLVSINSKSAY